MTPDITINSNLSAVMALSPSDMAARLNGCEYLSEISSQDESEAKAAGLVVVFGASDDLIEFRGAIDDEVGAFDGGDAYLNKEGLLKSECEHDDCPYFAKEKARAAVVSALWGSEGFSWTYETSIPHASFLVMEDGDKYCRGIVFRLSDVDAVMATKEC